MAAIADCPPTLGMIPHVEMTLRSTLILIRFFLVK